MAQSSAGHFIFFHFNTKKTNVEATATTLTGSSQHAWVVDGAFRHESLRHLADFGVRTFGLVFPSYGKVRTRHPD